MTGKKKWVVEGILEGNLFIPESDSNLPVKGGRALLTRYAILEQDLAQRPSRKILLGLEIPTNEDYVCIAYQEMEAFARALAIEKNVPITVYIHSMTDKQEEWPEAIEFLETPDFAACSGKWEPVEHYKDPKNRVKRWGGISSAATTVNLSSVLEGRHRDFSAHDCYRSELVKDYLAGLDVERGHPSLAMLYYFKVLERVGKTEYGNPPKRAMNNNTMNALIGDMRTELTDAEKDEARSVLRWRHTKSEAHVITEGMPTDGELQLCKKMAHYFLVRALSPRR